MRRSENVRSLAPPPVLKPIGTVEVAALAATAAVMPVRPATKLELDLQC